MYPLESAENPANIDSLFGKYSKQQKPRASMQRFLVLGRKEREIRGHTVVTHDFNQYVPGVRKTLRTTQCDKRNIVSHVRFLFKPTQMQRRGSYKEMFVNSGYKGLRVLPRRPTI